MYRQDIDAIQIAAAHIDLSLVNVLLQPVVKLPDRQIRTPPAVGVCQVDEGIDIELFLDRQLSEEINGSEEELIDRQAGCGELHKTIVELICAIRTALRVTTLYIGLDHQSQQLPALRRGGRECPDQSSKETDYDRARQAESALAYKGILICPIFLLSSPLGKPRGDFFALIVFS